MEVQKLEIRRQGIHLAGILAVPLAFTLGQGIVIAGSLLLALGLGILALYRGHKGSIKTRLALSPASWAKLVKVEKIIYGALDSVERESHSKKYPYYSAITFFLASGSAYLLLSLPVASLAVTTLALGDSVSTLIGSIFGTRKIPGTGGKTWEGFLAGLFACVLGGMVLATATAVPLTWVPAAALAGALAEAGAQKIDDNLLIPLVVASVITLIF